MLMAYVFAGGTYRLDYFQSQSIFINSNAGNNLFDLPRNFIVDYQYLDR